MTKDAFTPFTSDSGLPVSVVSNPMLSTWLSVDASARLINVYSGKVELGQNILTAIGQIAAHELGITFDRINMVPACTGRSPDESITSGSLSVQHSGMAVRMACQQLRRMFVHAAAERYGVSSETIVVDHDGRFRSEEQHCASYWNLAASVDLNVAIAPTEQLGADQAFEPSSLPSIGLLEKTSGRYGYIHDMKVAGVLHGRMLRPPSINARLLQLDTSTLEATAGVVAIVKDGSLVGVLAEQEHIAEQVVARLAQLATWQETASLPSQQDLVSWMRRQTCQTTDYAQAASGSAPASVARTYSSDYFKPFIKHASIGPSCAYASTSQDGGLSVWTHSQGIYNLRTDLAVVFGLEETEILVQHVPGAGCYGHNGADDVAFDAAWLSRYAQGRMVRVQWSRADELCWSPQGPAMSIALEADVDQRGRIIDWRHQVWSPGHSLRPGRAKTSTLLGSWYQAEPNPVLSAINAPISAGGGAERNIIPSYDIPCSVLASHRILHMPIRTSSLRCLGAFGNVFAIESMLDDIADDHGVDPIDYRLSMVSDPRASELLQAVRTLSGWDDVRNVGAGNDAPPTGWGVAFAQYKHKGAYCAVVAQVSVTHKVVVNKLFIAADVGEVINPEGVVQQVEGGAIQATSWATIEQAGFNDRALTDENWETYPIIRFSDVPDVEVQILARPDQPPLGAGECSLGPTGAAIANAVKNALGVRVNAMPMTFEQVSRAIEALV